MATDPHRILLDRDLPSVLIKENFADSLGLLEELVNYGSNLIPRCFISSEKKIPDIVVVLNFLKQGVSLMDSIHILVARGATVACLILLRSLFEISIYLDWIFQKDSERRGTLYFVWDLRKKLYWARSMRKGTSEHEAHKIHMIGAPIGAVMPGLDESSIDKTIETLRKLCALPECTGVDSEFESYKNGLRDRDWYVPGGVNNFREMAKAVKREGEYKVFYSSFSAHTHGLSLDHQVAFPGDGKVNIEPIRNLNEIDTIFRNTFNFGINIYRTVLTRYRHGELANFDRKYTNEWRKRFLSVKQIKRKDGGYTISNLTLPRRRGENL
jgi:hypothetical protein